MSSIITSINTAAFEFTKSIASPGLNSVMSFLGNDIVVVIILLIIALYLFYKKDKNVFAFLFAAVLIYVLTDIIKLIIREPRPCTVSDLSWINTVGCDSSTFSFPSNHSTILTGLSVFVGSYKYLRIIYIVWLILILFGRVYLGAHYFTDVIAGFIIGLLIGLLVYKFKAKINDFFSKIAKKIIPQLFNISWKNEY
ncbi:MAG: phosphatase PAP2 family protein [Candidatus Micrarchaeaceae archaeon]